MLSREAWVTLIRAWWHGADDEDVEDLASAIQEEVEDREALIEDAWGLIATGDWKRQTPAWQMAAHRWAVKAGYRREP
jgi:hypothetical protein